MPRGKPIPASDEELKRLYLDEKKSARDIAKSLDVSVSGITRRLSLLGCVRSPSERMRLAFRQGRLSPPMHSYRQDIDDNIVKKLYLYRHLSTLEIGRRLGCSASTVHSRLRRRGCLRSRSEAMRLAYTVKRKHPTYRGGRFRRRNGYVYVLAPNHPRASAGYVAEHLLVWEQRHGELPTGWVIHHLNGIKDDNRPENLVGLAEPKHKRVIPLLQERIRELEEENLRLRRELEADGH